MPISICMIILEVYFNQLAQLVVRVLPIVIRVPLRMGSSSHGGERKGQLGPSVTVPMSELPLEGYLEGSRRVWTPQLEMVQINYLSFSKFSVRFLKQLVITHFGFSLTYDIFS